jgi:hypothetical protein
VEWARYLTEVRSNAADWRAAFLRALRWELEGGVIYHRLSRWRDEIGLYELVELAPVVEAHPELSDRIAAEACPFVGPARGFLAWTVIDRVEDARAFGVASGRAGRGLVVDRGLPGARRIPPTMLDTVELGTVSIASDRLWFLPDISAVLKHSNDMLLDEDDKAYVEHVRRAMYRLPDASPPRRPDRVAAAELRRAPLRDPDLALSPVDVRRGELLVRLTRAAWPRRQRRWASHQSITVAAAPGRARAFILAPISARRAASVTSGRSAPASVAAVSSDCLNISAAPASAISRALSSWWLSAANG